MEIERRLRDLSPIEVISPEGGLSTHTEFVIQQYQKRFAGVATRDGDIRTERVSDSAFKFEGALSELVDLFGNTIDVTYEEKSSKQPLSSLGSDELYDKIVQLTPQALCCFRGISHYLRKFGLQDLLRYPKLEEYQSQSHMLLPGSTLADLEILEVSVGLLYL